MTPQEVVASARTYLGCPWHHCGRVRDGIDCSGLVVCAYRDAGIQLADQAGYSRGDEFRSMLARLEQSFVLVDEWKPGDVLLFRARAMTNHCGIVTTERDFIHSYSGASVSKVIEEPISSAWVRRIHSIWRYGGFR